VPVLLAVGARSLFASPTQATGLNDTVDVEGSSAIQRDLPGLLCGMGWLGPKRVRRWGEGNFRDAWPGLQATRHVQDALFALQQRILSRAG